MSSPSNLYAEKVFAEHPLALWALDDDAGYLTLIPYGDRNLETWTISNGFAYNAPDEVKDEPFVGSFVTKIVGDQITEDSGVFSATSPNIINFSSLNKSLGVISIGGYFYVESPYVTAIEIGYEYYDTVSGTSILNTEYYPVGVYEEWSYISATFEYPDQNTDLRIVVRAIHVKGPESTTYPIFVNGLTMGQWAEEFQSVSLGANAYPVPADLPLDVQAVLPAKAYGLTDNDAYYIAKDSALIAKNTGIPMVYGASNVTSLYPNTPGLPSLVIPGMGFLNETGKYQDLTLEFWIRIASDTSEPKRIVGPIASEDGLYVNGPFLMLVVDGHYESYYVGEWSRPMLVDIRFINNNASLLVNGERVISIDLITSSLSFPSKENESGVNQDWIGFYAYDDVPTIDLDCVAIYSYQVPTLVAKRRWVYGQGVEFPENINTSYSGTSAFIDYKFADYTSNYSYPQTGRWNQAIVDNFAVVDNTLSLPSHPKPEIVTQGIADNLISAWQTIQNESDTFMSLKPNSEWDSINSSLYFDKLNLSYSNVKAVFGVFKSLVNIVESPESLIELHDKDTGNYIKIVYNVDSIDYIVKYFGEEKLFYSTQRYYAGEQFSIGFDIDKLSNYFGGEVAAFLGRLENISVYVGGSKDLTSTFNGNIYKFGMFNKLAIARNSDPFAPNGIVADHQSFLDAGVISVETPADSGNYSREFWSYILDGGSPASYATSSLMSITATYSAYLNIMFGSYFIDIQSQSYWQDYIPLVSFAKYVSDKRGDKYYDLDFIQFNIDYPAPSKYAEEETVSQTGWSYAELYNEYSIPVQRTYTSLDNSLFTGYQNYQDLQERSQKTYKYDTSSSIVKTYITFQYLSEGANKTSYVYTNTEAAPKDGIVIPGDNWLTTKYEVVDNMVIYPPQDVDFKDVAIVTHIEASVDGTSQKPLKIRSLQYASQAFNDGSYNPVGTRFGVPIYPYRRSGVYYDFKSVNPFTIYKDSSPYLYLTRTSGIQPRGQYDPLINRGLMIPINQTKAADYKIIAMQAAIRYDEDFFPYAPTQIMEVEAKDTFIKIMMVATDSSGKRAKLYGVNGRTGRLENGIAFYWNGNIVKEPVITIKEWGMLGLSFAGKVDVSNTVGFVRITAPILVNNVSYYQSTNLQEVQQITPRSWFSVRQFNTTVLDWQYWESFYLWNGVLVISSKSFYGVDPGDIYKTYVGTNKIIVDDTRELVIGGYEYNVISNVRWQTNVTSAV